MSTALRQASHVLVTAARLSASLYKELAVSASGLLRPETYRSR
jgi:hypothetical protein